MPPKRLYLKNLPASTNRDEVFKYLERFGRLTELKIIENYGFAQFASEQDAKYVLDAFRDRLFLGHRTTVEFARPLRKDMESAETRSSRSSDSRNRHSPDHSRSGVQPTYYPTHTHQCRYPVLVDNIPRHVCWQELKDFGRSSGGLVAYCNLDRNRIGRGFIEYLSQEDAEEAIRTLDGEQLGGIPVRVWSNSRAPHRRSRSRSPIRRTSYYPFARVPYPQQTNDDRRRCAFPISASHYSLQRSPERPSSPLRSDDPTLPVVLHSDLHSCSKAVDSYHNSMGPCLEPVAARTAFMSQTPSFDSNYDEPFAYVKQPAAEFIYDFDRYLQASYDRSRLEYLPDYYP
ncbi:hypothetical protein B0H10DRAFT_45402 [Mycena sp. CBHHK59/15]|nr:hypothetical protein B0H10DRAFT_45402 [Mycena sp. CBHHK59/15]